MRRTRTTMWALVWATGLAAGVWAWAGDPPVYCGPHGVRVSQNWRNEVLASARINGEFEFLVTASDGSRARSAKVGPYDGEDGAPAVGDLGLGATGDKVKIVAGIEDWDEHVCDAPAPNTKAPVLNALENHSIMVGIYETDAAGRIEADAEPLAQIELQLQEAEEGVDPEKSPVLAGSGTIGDNWAGKYIMLMPVWQSRYDDAKCTAYAHEYSDDGRLDLPPFKAAMIILKVDLDIQGVADEDEDTKGAVLISKEGQNKIITLQPMQPPTWNGYVVLSKANDKIKIQTLGGGAELKFDGTDNRFASGALPKAFVVTDNEPSDNTRDATVTLQTEGFPTCKDSVAFTVLWVTIATDHEGSMEGDNAGRETVSTLFLPPSIELGYHLVIMRGSDNNRPYVNNVRASEFIGQVKPSDFKPGEFGASMQLSRDSLGGMAYYGPEGQENPTEDPPRIPDTSPEVCRDDDPQSGGSAGKIYDLDAPGPPAMGAVLEPGQITIVRDRRNFIAWAVYKEKADDDWRRCSAVQQWFTRQSYKSTGPWDQGAASAGDAHTITDTDKNWTVNQWLGGIVRIVSGKGVGQVRMVMSNEATMIRVVPGWDSDKAPDASSKYEVISVSTWEKSDDVPGDNKNGDGRTETTWNLQAP